MSKADIVAFEYARTLSEDYNQIYDAVKYGYHQAEKDLELTWEDLAIIKQLSDDFVKHNQTPMSDEEFYKEIVKRFKERKL